MANGFSTRIMDFCRLELPRVFMPDENLRALCEKFGHPFMPDGPAAAAVVCDRVEAAIRTGSPLSLLRVGNGEGNAVSMLKQPLALAQERTFFQEFNSQNGVAIPVSDAIRFCAEVRSALISADILGFRSFRAGEKQTMESALQRNDAYALLGILYAREFLQDGLQQGFLHQKFLTSAWIHLDLIPFLGRLLSLSDRIIVITGRSELHAPFQSRLGSRLSEFITVPVQGFAPPSTNDSHYYKSFTAVSDHLRRDLQGTLVLVGAGLFGKVYCNIARMHGGVAIDLGSTFDVLAGLTTRPVHAKYDFAGVSWL